jgi:hypothetical protein
MTHDNPALPVMTIDASKNRWWFAELRDTPDGVAVDIYRRLYTDSRKGSMVKLEHRDVIDMPMHVVCDRILDLLNQLSPMAGRTTGGER